jgi:hypothetical protein
LTDLNQPVLRLIVVAALIVNLALIALAWRAAFRGRPVWSKRWGWVCLGVIVLPAPAAAFFPSIAGGDALNFGFGMLNCLAGVWFAGIALCPWVSFEKTNNPHKPRRGPVAATLVRAGALAGSLLLLWMGSFLGVGDFSMPADIVEGRVEHMYLSQGWYGTYSHMLINGRSHVASKKAYEHTKVGALVNAEVGAVSGHIYRVHLQ